MRSAFLAVLCLGLLSASAPAQPADETGFVPLFDGKTLDGWKGEDGWWRVEDGVVMAESTPERPLDHNTFLVWQGGDVADFELRLSFRLTGSPSANSGIQFRSAQRPDGHLVGYQADIDRAGNWVGALYDEEARGVLARRGQKVTAAAGRMLTVEQIGDAAELLKGINIDDWNDYSIAAEGNHITLKINGKVTSELIDNDPEGFDKSGLLALQLHTGPPMKIEFRDVRLKKSTPVAQASPPVERSDAAADAIEQLNVHPELRATLFASEPMMTNPSSIDVDHLGRVWVCEAVNYRAFANGALIGRDRAPDRILILEDKNRDGVADASTVFHQDHAIDSAHGILVLPTAAGPGLRALVSAGDSVFFLTDTDGDLKSDEKQVLFTGISGVQHDHGVHSFHFGPDGKLYFNFGNEGKQIKDKDGQAIVDKAGNEVNNSRQPYQEGMAFRCNLDGSEFETLGWNFRNNWELCIDPFGTIWQSDNDDDGNRGVRLNYVMEFGNYGYKDEFTGSIWQTARTNWEADIPLRHWHLNDPGVMPNLIQTGAGAPTGIAFYEGTLLPPSLRGAVLHVDAGTSSLIAYLPAQQGAGYTAQPVSLLDGSRNNWFRPSDVCVGPAGELYVSDWYDPGVGGHRMRDIERGRVMTLWPAGSPAAVAPGLDLTTPQGAAAALVSPNMSTRYLGWTALETMGEPGIAALQELLKSDNPARAARALWRLAKLPGDNARTVAVVRAGLGHANPDLRIAALRCLRQVLDRVSYTDVADAIDLRDPDPRVRRELLIGLRDIPESWMPSDIRGAYRTEGWVQLAQQYDGADRWYLEALGLSADGRWDELLDAYLATQGTDWTSTAAARDIVWRSRSEKTPLLLAQLLRNPALPADAAPRYLRALDFQTGPSVEPVLLQLAFGSADQPAPANNTIRAEALLRLTSETLAATPERQAAADAIVDSLAGTSQFIQLVDRMNLQDRYPALLALAQSQPLTQLGADAMRTLRSKRQTRLINEALAGENREQVEGTLLALGTLGDRQSVGQLREFLGNAQNSLWSRQAAVRALGNSQAGARSLLTFAGESPPQELREALAAALAGSPFENIRREGLALYPPPPGKNAQPLPPINVLSERVGDVANGRIVYNTAGTCNKCHQVNGIGTEIGPNLSEIGAKLAKPALYESILYPSAAISHNFENWAVGTVDGTIYSGLLVSDTPSQLQIKEANGLVRTIPAADVEMKRKQDISLMPSDIQKLLSEQELVDLVEYLATLKERRR